MPRCIYNFFLTLSSLPVKETIIKILEYHLNDILPNRETLTIVWVIGYDNLLSSIRLEELGKQILVSRWEHLHTDIERRFTSNQNIFLRFFFSSKKNFFNFHSFKEKIKKKWKSRENNENQESWKKN